MDGEEFIPLITPPEALTQPSYWFVFRGNNLLVRREEKRAYVPHVDQLSALGIEPLRTQYLGVLGNAHCFSAECAEDVEPPSELAWSGLRALFGLIDDTTFALAGRAIQIMDWDRSHQFCGRCGTPTERKIGERARACPNCGQTHYPRIAPAVMALVHRGNELLLARSPHFPPGMFSALAGFVEPGESLEQCLHREVLEEVGVTVKNVRYFSSQPWPFPHSLMIAFNCEYESGELVPQEGEIEAVDWFTLDRLPPQLPGRLSIARRLIDAALKDLAAGH